MGDDLIEKAIELACFRLFEKNTEEAYLILNQILKLENNKIISYFYSLLNDNKKIEEITNSDLANDLGILFNKSGKHEEATELFFKSLILNNKNHHALCNLAGCYKHKKMYWTACKLLLKSIEYKENKQTLINLSQVYGELKMIQQAKECLNRVLELDADCYEAKVNLATVLFLENEWEKPGILYRERYKFFPSLKKLLEVFPEERMWDGKCLINKKMIVLSEQGIGDIFNFIEFVKILNKKFPKNKIRVLVPESVRSFIKNQGFKTIEKVDNYDLWCSMIDLPWLLSLNKKEVIRKKFFKSNEKCDFSFFKDKFKIGICWAGNPANPRDKHRSCHLKFFQKIHDLPNVKLFSLQSDTRPRIWEGDTEVVDLTKGSAEMKIINMQPYMKSWDNTASIINELDLIVSVDTSIMHLSAALNKPTFGVISYLPDWRWGLDSKENMWYPSLKLFRQKEIDDWESVFEEIANEISYILVESKQQGGRHVQRKSKSNRDCS